MKCLFFSLIFYLLAFSSRSSGLSGSFVVSTIFATSVALASWPSAPASSMLGTRLGLCRMRSPQVAAESSSKVCFKTLIYDDLWPSRPPQRSLMSF